MAKKQESKKPDKPSRPELDRQLDEALKATFPASDPISVGEPSSTTPERPVHRRPAAIDKALVRELAANVEAGKDKRS